MNVLICGSWRPEPGSYWYDISYQLGNEISKAGHTIITGAYSGVMEGASRGAAEAGGEAIGISCPEIDELLPPNRWITREIKAKSLLTRLSSCLEMSEAIVFLPGRAGTASELSVAVEMRAKGFLRKPLMLYGDFWKGYFEWFQTVSSSLDFPSDSWQPVSHIITPTVPDVVNALADDEIQ